MNYFFSIFLFFFFSQNAVFAQVADTIKKPIYDFRYFKKGLVEQNQGNYTTAILDFTIFIDDHKAQKPYWKAYYHRANSYRYIKDYKKAIADFQVLNNITTTTDGALGAGQCYSALNDHKKAIEWFKKGLQRNPFSAQLYNELGMQLCATNDFSAGVRSFHQAIKYDSTFATAYNNIGTATYFDQDVDSPEISDVMQAKSWFDKALHHDTTLVLAWRNRGAVQFFLKNYSEAKADLEHALRINQRDSRAHLYLGITEAALNNDEKAVSELQEAARLEPNLQIAYEELGHVATKRKMYEKALELYNETIKVSDPKEKQYQGLVWYYKAVVYALQSDEKNTKNALQKVKQLGAFNEKSLYILFLKEPIFKKYKDENWLISLKESLLKTAKENKFLNTKLKWFKMREGASSKVGR